MELVELVRVTLAGCREQDRPEPGETEVESRIEPEKPLIDVNAIVDVPGAPARMETLAGVAPMVKSFTWYWTVAV